MCQRGETVCKLFWPRVIKRNVQGIWSTHVLKGFFTRFGEEALLTCTEKISKYFGWLTGYDMNFTLYFTSI